MSALPPTCCTPLGRYLPCLSVSSAAKRMTRERPWRESRSAQYLASGESSVQPASFPPHDHPLDGSLKAQDALQSPVLPTEWPAAVERDWQAGQPACPHYFRVTIDTGCQASGTS